MSPQQSVELGRYIRTVRIQRGMTMYQLERECDLNRSTLARLERGHFRSTNPTTMSKIANVLNIELAELYKRAEIPVPELPSFTPYLRTKYDQLPRDTIDQIERYAAKLARNHGVSITGPAPGEDEAPEP